MAIEKKLIHFGKLADFEAQLTAGNILDYSIVFIQDAKKIWTHGTYYDCSEGTVAGDIVQSDWNESDSASDAFVKNRTHYANFTEFEIPSTITTSTDTFISYPGTIGKTIYARYTCDINSVDVSIKMDADDNDAHQLGFGPVFTIRRGVNGVYVSGTYHASQKLYLATGVLQLGDIYIPETIARTSELKTINGESIYGGGDITIEGGSLTESDIAAMGFTKNTGTYSKPSGGIPKSDLASAVQTSLGKADTALQSYTEQYKGTVTGVKMNGASKGSSGVVDLGNVATGVKINGSTKSPSSGVVDLGTVITSHQDISGKQDRLVSGTNIKTINGTSILGSGDISISGGGGGTITGVSANGTSIATSGVANIPAATTGAYGVTKLNSSTNSTSTTEAATPSAVRAVYGIAGGKQDKLVSGTNIKTINGESILGSGDISISGGGSGEDIRYFTEFTVEDIIEASKGGDTVTYDTTELLNAMKSNKVICVPYRGYDKGFIVASYKSGENVEYPDMYLQKGDIEYHAYVGDYYELIVETPIYNSVQVVKMAGGEVVFEVLDNHVYRITDPVDYLIPFGSTPQKKGTTIHFMSGESGTTIEMPTTFWANGEIPQIEPNTHYELSLMQNSAYENNAVLTPFKPVE